MTFWLDAQRNLVIYAGQPGILPQYIPDLKPLNGSYFAVPNTLANLQVLAWYNWPTPAPMQNYDFPIEPGKTPLPHQKIYANFQALHPRCFNLGDPGTMKTLSTLWAMDFLMQQHPPGTFRALIIAPLTLIDTVWAAAIFRNFLSRRSYALLIGDGDKRTKQLEKDVDCYIINPDGLKVGAHIRRKVDPRKPHQKRVELDGFSKALAARDDIKMVIIDEASSFKAVDTARHACATLIFGKKRWLWQLTGSPTPNRPTDAYGMAKLVNDAHGETFTNYKQRVMMNVSQFKWVPRAGASAEAHKLLQPAVRFAIEDCVELPPCTVQQREVPLSATQAKAYQTLKHEAVLAMQSGALVHAVNEAALRQKLIQVACGAVYDQHHDSYRLEPGPRLAEVDDIIEETDRKVVIFAPLTNVVHMLHEHLKGRYNCAMINGEVKGKARDDVIRRFGDPENELRIIVVDPGTVSHGVNQFVTANVAIWYGPTDKTEQYIQANKRIDRPGQTVPTTIIQLVATKTEKEIFARLEANESMQGVVLKLAEE